MTYWERRALARQKAYDRASDKTLQTVSKAYDRMVEQVFEDTERIIGGFQNAFGLTRAEAMALLRKPAPKKILDELRARLKGVTDKKRRAAVEAMLSAPAYAARVTRLQAIKESAIVAAAQAADVEAHVGQVHFRDIAHEGFNRTMFDMQQYTGLGFGFSGLDTRRMDQILRCNWSGQQFSARVWHNSGVTAQTLSHALTEIVMQGKAGRQTFDELMEQAQGSRFAANRLLRTETNYITNQATAEAYEAAGITKYRFMAVLDGRTSTLCQEQDGKEYALKDKQVGVNYPPLHPWCRSAVGPVIDGISREHMTRRARDPVTGEETMVPRDMTYKEWRARTAGIHGESRVIAAEKKIRNRRADFRQWEDYRNIIGKRELPKTLEGFQEIKYNEPEKWRLMKGYVAGVRNYDLSTLTGFEHYQAVAGEIQKTLVSVVTSDGVEIKGFKTHFVDRVIGNYLTGREGVPVEDAKAVLVSEKSIIRQRVNSKGEVSRHYRNNVCGVTINPVTGLLIQTNPRK